MGKSKDDMGFAVCVTAKADDDLQAWKVYRVLHDPEATEVGCLRVIDESGEDYLYPERRFVVLNLPAETRRLLMKAARRKTA